MRIYMRHGNDEKKSLYKHDKSLDSSSQYEQSIIEKTKDLIALYGYPDKIYCSPFRRARETVHIMRQLLNVEIIINPNLSRFFQDKEKSNPSVRKKTMKYNPPIQESRIEFKQRVKQVEKIIDKEPGNIWCITHYLVIKQIGKKYNKEIPKRMPFLWHMALKND